MLIEGQWVERAVVEKGSRFRRAESQFRHHIEGTQEAPATARRFPVDAHRYRLYVAWACPWAHRTLLVRALYGLEEVLPVAVVQPEMMADGWTFDADHPDPFYGLGALRDLYLKAESECTSRVTVPVLWDSVDQTIVNNESSEVVRMLAGPMAKLGRPDATLAGHDLRPVSLASEIDRLNDRIYSTVNNGVYRCGFAGGQAAYDEACTALFDTLEWLEQRLGRQRWLAGNVFTEADLRLFPTLVRFDAVYHGHFKCNRRMLREYPALSAWTRDVFQLGGVADTVRMDETRRHYYVSHRSLNPLGIVPLGPAVDFSGPPGRAHLGPHPASQR